jgi:hypothetical protein
MYIDEEGGEYHTRWKVEVATFHPDGFMCDVYTFYPDWFPEAAWKIEEIIFNGFQRGWDHNKIQRFFDWLNRDFAMHPLKRAVMFGPEPDPLVKAI